MKIMHFAYDSSITDLRELNSSFDIGTLRICYTGANRNKTYFSKSVLERKIGTLYNVPIVAHYFREDGSIGGHDVEIITDYDNKLRMVNVTQPVGVIPESANIYFKEFEEEDGSVHEYLCADVIIWKRQEAYKVIKENGITAASMEINVKDGKKEDGLYHVTDFEFQAVALLGDEEPCFESAGLQLFSIGTEFKTQFSEMMEEFKETFSLATTSSEVEDKQISEKGGRCQMVDERNDGIEVAEEVTEEVTEVVTDEISDEVSEDTYALDSNLREGIYDALHAAMMHTEYGDRPRYCLCDYDTEAKIIYAWDEEDWLLYGFNYVMDGDKVVIDFESKKRMKYVIAEFDEGEDDQPSPFAFAYEEMKKSVKSAQDDLADMQSKYNDASEQINSLNEEVTELRQFKADSEAADEQAKRDKLFANFSDLSEVEEFSALVVDAAQYNLDELEEKCFAIRGKNVKMNFSKSEPKAPKLPVEHIDDMDNEHEPYGGVLKQYLIRK